jgi:cell division protein FtsL
MIFRATAVGFILAAVIGVMLFHIKYQVLTLEQELAQTHQEIFKTEESLHLLRAEWAYLNDPKRLQKLAVQHLSMKPGEIMQVVDLRDLHRVEQPRTPSGEMQPVLASLKGPQ